MKVKYTKSEAAQSQLDLAIKLYFTDEDPASIHTLYSAAHKIISNLLNRSGKVSSIDEMVALVKPEKKKEAYVLFHRVGNYLKHADSDSMSTLEFDTELNDLSLFMALRDYQALRAPITLNMALFRLWFVPNNAELFLDTSNNLGGLLKDLKIKLQGIDKAFFFNNVPKMAEENGIDIIGDYTDG